MSDSHFFDSRMENIWHDFIAHFQSNSTVASYRSDLEEFLQFSQKPFTKITAEDVKAYFTCQKKRVEQGGLKPSTLAKKIRELNSISSYIYENKERYGIDDNYQNHFEAYRNVVEKVSRLAKAIPVEHIDRLLAASQKDDMAYCIFILLYRMGFSTTEIIELRPNALSVFKNGAYMKVPGRKDACFVPEDVYQILEAYLSDFHDGNEYLFYNKKGRKLYPMYISRLMKKYTSQAGLPSYSAEALRNSCAYTMFSYHVKPDQVAKEMGVTSKQIYRYRDYNYLDTSSRTTRSMVKIKIEPPNTNK